MPSILRTIDEPNEIDPYFAKWTAKREVGCTLEEYRTLYSIAKEFQPKRILEIGPGCGASSMAFCLGSQALEFLRQVTIHPEQRLEVVAAEFWGKIHGLNLTSDEYFRRCDLEWLDVGQFDLIFIDGDHREDVFERDSKNAYTHLASGGTIICHDTYQTDIGCIGAICRRMVQSGVLGLSFTELDLPGKGLGIFHSK